MRKYVSDDEQGKRYRGLLFVFFLVSHLYDEDTDILVSTATDGSLDIHTSVTGTQ